MWKGGSKKWRMSVNQFHVLIWVMDSWKLLDDLYASQEAMTDFAVEGWD